MKSTQYSEKVLDHFRNPRNVGTLEGENIAVGRVGNPVCGDLMDIYIKVQDDTIEDIRFKTFGCGSAIATASMVTELSKGKRLDEALKISRGDVAAELDGLPPVKMHCSNLAADALHEAIKNYRSQQAGKAPAAKENVPSQKPVKGAEKFGRRGVFYAPESPFLFKNKRVLVVYAGEESVETAIELTNYTGRVVLATHARGLKLSPRLQARLRQSDVKVLYESRLAEVRGTSSVEKVLIHDLNEDEEYELVVDAVILFP